MEKRSPASPTAHGFERSDRRFLSSLLLLPFPCGLLLLLLRRRFVPARQNIEADVEGLRHKQRGVEQRRPLAVLPISQGAKRHPRCLGKLGLTPPLLLAQLL